MDISTLLVPGAQNLATAMLSDAWGATRDAIARYWGRGHRKEAEELAAGLEDSRSQALALFPGASEEQSQMLEAFLAGYLAALAREDPGRLQMLASPSFAITIGGVMSGQADRVVQIQGDVHGGVHM